MTKLILIGSSQSPPQIKFFLYMHACFFQHQSKERFIECWCLVYDRLVIMVLIDVANGKQRHVPYRDSKLTYLLQVIIYWSAQIACAMLQYLVQLINILQFLDCKQVPGSKILKVYSKLFHLRISIFAYMRNAHSCKFSGSFCELWMLCHVVQDSLGGNSKTAIIATVSPSSW